MIELFTAIFDFLIGGPWRFIKDLIQWIQDLITVHLVNAVWHMLPPELADYLNDIDLSALAGIVEPVTWFIPIWAILVIYFSAYSMAAAIRITRFVIGFVPTVEG